jgi:hypothetical protein
MIKILPPYLVSLCNVSGLANPIHNTYLHVLTPAGARGPTPCGISNDDACGGLKSEIIATYPMGFVCSNHPVVFSSNPRWSLPLAAGDTLIIVVQQHPNSVPTSETEYRLEITEYPLRSQLWLRLSRSRRTFLTIRVGSAGQGLLSGIPSIPESPRRVSSTTGMSMARRSRA